MTKRTPLQRPPIATRGEAPLQLQRSPEYSATIREEDSATTQEKPLATKREDAPGHCTERGATVWQIQTSPPPQQERSSLYTVRR